MKAPCVNQTNIDTINDMMGIKQREENRCAKLLYFLNRLEGLYKISTGRNFRYFRFLYNAIDGSLIHEAIRDIKEAGVVPYNPEDIDPCRAWNQMTLADMEVIDSVLKYSALDEFLLIHYDETALWSCKALECLDDFWTAYGGLLQECRSPIVNIETMEYAMLPFAKFRNLNEGAEYSLDAVKDRIGRGTVVEFSEKLDGSMIQMRYIGNTLPEEDKRFWHGIMIATSGSLYPDRAPQLHHVLGFMTEDGERIEKLVKAYPYNTFLFEWIDSRDEHMVRYGDRQGLFLIGIRNIDFGWMLNYSRVIELAKRFGIPTTRLFSMSFDEALVSLENMKGSVQEGYVLNVDGFLVKIKCPEFLNLMRAATISSSFNTIVRYATDGTVDDFIAMLPASYQAPAKEKLKKLRAFEYDMRTEVERLCASLPADRKAAMMQIDRMNADGMLKGLIRARYLGRPVEIIAKHKGNTIQYIRESDIDRYYANQSPDEAWHSPSLS